MEHSKKILEIAFRGIVLWLIGVWFTTQWAQVQILTELTIERKIQESPKIRKSVEKSKELKSGEPMGLTWFSTLKNPQGPHYWQPLALSPAQQDRLR